MNNFQPQEEVHRNKLNAKIAHLIKVALERLEQDENKQIAVDTLKLYEVVIF